ncbi:terminase small subunit [Novosphingobium olei]|uniref:terminase small subunit n=1 Tax=Novosphingobium olei TaxID=2728851 RepID=UPI0030931FE7|nr:terminase small subunit [Novosphingobium olei]
MSLTPKQEAFCLAYIETGNASEAYRQAYDARKMKAGAIHVAASKLLDNPKVALMVDELKAAHAARHEMTVDRIRDMLLEDRTFARDCGTPAAAVSATMGLAKLYGHLRDKVEHTGKDGKDLPAPAVAIFALPDNGR